MNFSSHHFFKYLLEFTQNHYCELDFGLGKVTLSLVAPNVMRIRKRVVLWEELEETETFHLREEFDGTKYAEYYTSPPKGFASLRQVLSDFALHVQEKQSVSSVN